MYAWMCFWMNSVIKHMPEQMFASFIDEGVMLPNSLITGAVVWSPEGSARVLAHTHKRTLHMH